MNLEKLLTSGKRVIAGALMVTSIGLNAGCSSSWNAPINTESHGTVYIKKRSPSAFEYSFSLELPDGRNVVYVLNSGERVVGQLQQSDTVLVTDNDQTKKYSLPNVPDEYKTLFREVETQDTMAQFYGK